MVIDKKLSEKPPIVIKNYFSEDRLSKIINSINSMDKSHWVYEDDYKRYRNGHPYVDKLTMFELDRAREIFDNDKLLPTYSLFCLYNQNDSFLGEHKDNNACTYTLDICLYAKKPWDLYIEGVPYTSESNSAICFYGEDHLNWRDKIEEDNSVLMMFLHFADRDHWWFQANNVESIG
jgi:hypothetical protein